MKNAKVLDCTLRDGAYLVDKTFGDPVIKGIIDGLVKSKIDFIEIGFFQDDGFGTGKTVFKNSEDAKRSWLLRAIEDGLTISEPNVENNISF